MSTYQIVAVSSSLLSILLGGGLLKVWLLYKTRGRELDAQQSKDQRKERRDDFEMLIRIVTGQRDEAWTKLAEKDKNFERMELEIQGLRLSADMDPFPNWIVDLDGRYVFVNREFEKQFLEAEGMIYRDLIGERHSKIWPESFCETLRQLDQVARSRPDGKARATTAVKGRQITVHKFPVRVRGIPVAYAGYITDIEPLQEPPAATAI